MNPASPASDGIASSMETRGFRTRRMQGRSGERGGEDEPLNLIIR